MSSTEANPVPSTTIEGEYTTAEVKLPESEIEDSLREEIQGLIDSPGIRNHVVFMPDCHGGLGSHAIVGFSMPLGNRIIPNVIGGDIGCGMTVCRLSNPTHDPRDVDRETLDRIDTEIRGAIPMGTGAVHSTSPYTFTDDYAWTSANFNYDQLFSAIDLERPPGTDRPFDRDYFTALCSRVGADPGYIKRSLGTLGSGNHFIEVAVSETTDDLWAVVHSGSRNLGQAVKTYWQSQATTHRSNEVHYHQLTETEQQYITPAGEIKKEQIRADYTGEEIGAMFEALKEVKPDPHRNTKLDYLEGEEMAGYLRDMVFTQKFASVNRQLMIESVANILGAEIKEVSDSPHNYLGVDGVIRKGSTAARENEYFAVPMNMADGTLVCQGRGNAEWNYSAPHGSGRLGSRTWASEEFDLQETRRRLSKNDIYSSTVPNSEVPNAYKPVELIERQITPTATITDRLTPVINFKAPDV